MSKPAVLSRPAANDPCPCGSGKAFADCCGSLIDGSRRAENAEQVMRSRFTAHVINDDAYLHRTFTGTRQKPFAAEASPSPLGWTKLQVHAHEPGSTPDQAFVEFSAYYVDGESPEHVLQERSEFKRVDGEWLYHKLIRSGPAPKRVAVKAGRNDPCPCGSGKKYKHCCLN